MTSPIGQTLLDQYRVDTRIASGGMGAVYRVLDLKRNVPLAMKVLHADLAEDPSVFKRFEREARALKKLAHPNIVPFYGLFRTSDLVFLLEQYIDGPTLKEVLRQRGAPLRIGEALIYLKALCAALGYAHAHGIVHCDVKPSNVMIDRGGNVYLTDFGVARHAESTTVSLGSAGTPAYMAPEQARGEAVTPQTDIYALGILLFEMLTGVRPFTGEQARTTGSYTGSTSEKMRWEQIHLEPPSPRKWTTAITPGLEKVIFKCLAKRPSDRYASAIDLYHALELECQASDQSTQISMPLEQIQPAPVPEVYKARRDSWRSFWGLFRRKTDLSQTISPSYGGSDDEPTEVGKWRAVPSAYLITISGPNRGAEYALSGTEVSLGRSSTADIIVQDRSVSREHCKIGFSDGSYALFDLSSSNGTFVNEQRIRQSTRLFDGDLIRLGGEVTLLFTASPKQHKIRKLWDQVNSSLYIDEAAFFLNVKEFVSELCYFLELPLPSFDQLPLQKDFHFVYVDTTRAFTDTLLPVPLPVILTGKAELAESDIESLRFLVTVGQAAEARLAVLILFGAEEQSERIRHLILDRIRGAHAYDLVVLGIGGIGELVASRDPHHALRRLLLSQVDLIAVNPFKTVGPVPESIFFGRESQMREIVQHAASSSYAVIGRRCVGKTSLLNRLWKTRLPSAGFRALYHDCIRYETGPAFLIAMARDWWPAIPSDAPITFRELFQSPPTDKPLVLLLDEVDRLVATDRSSGWSLFNTLRERANSGHFQVVLSGERILREALRDPNSPLFNFTNKMLLGPLDFNAVGELIAQPMKQLEIELVDEVAIVQRVFEFTSGHPNIVQRLCHRLIILINERHTRRITNEDVNTVIADPGFQREDFLDTYWERVTTIEKIISLLMAEDKSVRTLNDVRQALIHRCDIHSKALEVDEALQRLVDLSTILRRTTSGYEFAVEAFPRVVADTVTLKDLLQILVEEYREQAK